VRIEATPEVGTYVRERGGRLYLWLKPVSRRSDFARFTVSFEDDFLGSVDEAADLTPAEFDAYDLGGFEVLVDPGLEASGTVKLSLRHRPRKRIVVEGFDVGFVAGGDWGPGAA
jgi:hypothetical protein